MLRASRQEKKIRRARFLDTGPLAWEERGMKQPAPNGTVPFGTRIPEPMHRRLRVECARRGVSIVDATTEALEQWLKRREPKKEVAK